MHGGRHVHLRQALAALGVVEAHMRAALQRQPHALTVCHHAGDAAAAVGAHLEPVLQRREVEEEGGVMTEVGGGGPSGFHITVSCPSLPLGPALLC